MPRRYKQKINFNIHCIISELFSFETQIKNDKNVRKALIKLIMDYRCKRLP